MPPHIALVFCHVRRRTSLSLYLSFILLATSAFGQQPQFLLGDTHVERSLDSNPSGTAEAFRVRAVATGQVNSVSVFLDRSNSASTVWVGIYTNSNGHPYTLISNGMISHPLAGRWNSVNVPPVQVNRGAIYWLTLLGVNGIVKFRDRTGWCRSETSRQSALASLPTTWQSGSRWSSCIVSMFETGTVTTGTGTQGGSVSISPHTVSLLAGQQQQFAAAVNGLSSSRVIWTASGGTINSAGLYTAPSSGGTYTVTAASATSGSGSDSAVVTVALPTPPPPPTVTKISISPTAVSLQTGAQQQFTALVSGTSNTAVTWSASAGTIATNGLYTAPSAAGTYTISAISKADTSKFASAIVIVSAPQTVIVSVSPAAITAHPAQQVQFTATVSGISNTAVTWSVTQGSGTITQTGLYTAPQGIENDIITATSQGDTTKSARASITLIPQHSVALSWLAPPSSTTVAFYNVYRGTVKGGPYSLLATNVTSTHYTDSTVQPGTTYFYVTTTVDPAKVESIFSNELQSTVPTP
jgi:hypothetical protein